MCDESKIRAAGQIYSIWSERGLKGLPIKVIEEVLAAPPRKTFLKKGGRQRDTEGRLSHRLFKGLCELRHDDSTGFQGFFYALLRRVLLCRRYF